MRSILAAPLITAALLPSFVAPAQAASEEPFVCPASGGDGPVVDLLVRDVHTSTTGYLSRTGGTTLCSASRAEPSGSGPRRLGWAARE